MIQRYKNLVKSVSVILGIIILVLIPSFAMAAEGLINIDGYYDDWEDKPHTPVTYGGWNGLDVHSVALFLDGEYLSGHIKMNDIHGTGFPPDAMSLRINDKYTLQFMVRFKNSDNTINWGGPIYNLPVGTTLELAVFDNHDKKAWLGDAAITVYDSGHSIGDEVEFYINLENISRFSNDIPIDEMQTFTLSCPNIGKEGVTITGTSTAPYIGIVLTLAVVSLAALFRRKQTDGKII